MVRIRPFENSNSKSNLTVGRTSDLRGYSRWKGVKGKIVVGGVAFGAVGQIHHCKISPGSQHG